MQALQLNTLILRDLPQSYSPPIYGCTELDYSGTLPYIPRLHITIPKGWFDYFKSQQLILSMRDPNSTSLWWNKFVGFLFFCDGFSNDHVFGLQYFIQRIWAVSLLLVSIYPVLEFDVRNYGEFLSEDHSMYIYRLWMLDYSSQLEVCGCNMSCVYRLVKTLVSKWFLVPSVRAIENYDYFSWSDIILIRGIFIQILSFVCYSVVNKVITFPWFSVLLIYLFQKI